LLPAESGTGVVDQFLFESSKEALHTGIIKTDLR
jgi:hypothetical protein